MAVLTTVHKIEHIRCISYKPNPTLLPRDAMHSADYAVESCPSVRPSVRHMPVYEMAKHIIKLFSHSSCNMAYNSCFFRTKRYGNTSSGTPLTSLNAEGYEKIAIFGDYLALSRK